MYKAIFLDWDNTIGDWSGAEALSLHDLYEGHHLSEFFESEEDFVRTYDEHNQALWKLYGKGEITKAFLCHDRFVHPLLKVLGLNFEPKAIGAFGDLLEDEFLHLTNKHFRLLPDAYEVTKKLSEKYPLTLISNGFKEVQYYKLETSGLRDCFRHILISEEVGINKPQPGIYEEALRRNGIEAKDALMIGDSYFSDISGAKAAGIDQLWFTTNPGENTATYIVPKLTDILTIV